MTAMGAVCSTAACSSRWQEWIGLAQLSPDAKGLDHDSMRHGQACDGVSLQQAETCFAWPMALSGFVPRYPQLATPMQAELLRLVYDTSRLVPGSKSLMQGSLCSIEAVLLSRGIASCPSMGQQSMKALPAHACSCSLTYQRARRDRAYLDRWRQRGCMGPLSGQVG